MSDIQSPQYDEDTISLIDLIAVVVRHRRLIVIGTILAAIGAVAVVSLMPDFGIPAEPAPTYTVEQQAEQQLVLYQIPEEFRRYITVDPSTAIQALLTNPRFIGEIYRIAGGTPATGSPEQYLAQIRQNVIGGSYTVEWDSATASQRRIATLSYSAATPEAAQGFLDALTARLGDELTAQIGAQLADDASTVTAAIDRLTAIDENDGLSLGTLAYTEQQLQAFADDAGRFYTVLEGPAVYEVHVQTEQTPSRSSSTVIVIATITAFFLTVFLAFVLEYIRRVKTDREEMGKLETAWRRE